MRVNVNKELLLNQFEYYEPRKTAVEKASGDHPALKEFKGRLLELPDRPLTDAELEPLISLANAAIESTPEDSAAKFMGVLLKGLIRCQNFSYDLSEILARLNKAKVLDQAVLEPLLVIEPSLAFILYQGFRELIDNSGELSKDVPVFFAANRAALMIDTKNAVSLASAFNNLYGYSPIFLAAHRDTMIAHPAEAKGLALGFIRLHEISTLLNPKDPSSFAEGQAILIANAAHAKPLAEAFGELIKISPAFYNMHRAALLANAHHAEQLNSGFDVLRRHDLLSTYCENLLAHPEHAKDLAYALVELKGLGPTYLTNYANDLIANSEHARELSWAYKKLSDSPDFLVENRSALVAHAAHARSLATAFRKLVGNEETRTLYTLYRNTLIEHAEHADTLAAAFVTFFQTGGSELLAANLDTLLAHAAHADKLAEGLTTLSGDLLATHRDSLVANAEYADNLSLILLTFSRRNLLTVANKASIVNLANTNTNAFLGAVMGIWQLSDSPLLNQANLDAIILHAVVFKSLNRLGNVPPDRLNQALFDRLIELCRTHEANMADAVHACQGLITLTINGPAAVQAGLAQALTGGQNTHTESVHTSSSQSATRLKKLYGKESSTPAKITEKLKEIDAWLRTLPTDLSGTLSPEEIIRRKYNLAALQAFERIAYGKVGEDVNSHRILLDYSDRVTPKNPDGSGVTIGELLALLWTAIHDSSTEPDRKLSTDLNTAYQCLLEGLYESGRAYNIDVHGKEIADADEAAKQACAPGVFNKFIQVFVGIIPAATQRMVTPEQAAAKLRSFIGKEEALKFLAVADPAVVDLKKLTQQIREDENLEAIAKHIEAAVSKSLWAEFKEAYITPQFQKEYTKIEEGLPLSADSLNDPVKLLAELIKLQANTTERSRLDIDEGNLERLISMLQKFKELLESIPYVPIEPKLDLQKIIQAEARSYLESVKADSKEDAARLIKAIQDNGRHLDPIKEKIMGKVTERIKAEVALFFSGDDKALEDLVKIVFAELELDADMLKKVSSGLDLSTLSDEGPSARRGP